MIDSPELSNWTYDQMADIRMLAVNWSDYVIGNNKFGGRVSTYFDRLLGQYKGLMTVGNVTVYTKGFKNWEDCALYCQKRFKQLYEKYSYQANQRSYIDEF